MSNKSKSEKQNKVENKVAQTENKVVENKVEQEQVEQSKTEQSNIAQNNQIVENKQEVVEMSVTERFELVEAKVVRDKQINKEIGFASKSDAMRYLFDNGMTVAQISKFMSAHYSFVYGVISTTREIVKKSTTSKSDVIRQMFDTGMTAGQISHQLNSNYSFVFSVIKKYKTQLEAK